MNENITAQMAEVVEATMTAFKTDFYDYDKEVIESEGVKFPFIWIVGQCHTKMCMLGNYKDNFFESESYRFDYLSNPNPWEYYFTSTYYTKGKWFLVTENGLQPITLEQAEAAVMDYITPAVNAWVEVNGPLPKLTKVPVKFKNITLSKLKSLITDCRAHGDNSLFECFKRRHKSCRVAADQFAEITWHKGWNEFTFCEYINHKEGIEGHIVFHGWPETGYQTNNSIQLTPAYGWSTHT